MKLHTTRIGRALLSSVAALLGGAAVHGETLFQTFYSFTGGTDGQGPAAALLQATDGNFYGTTMTGGSGAVGTVFRLTPTGTVTTLYQFSGTPAYPTGALVQASDGYLYGTTQSMTAAGVAFRISPVTGAYASLHTFSVDEGTPGDGFVLGQDGNFYGITWTTEKVYKMTPSGTVTTVLTFRRDIEGAGPNSLVAASDGNLYGVTSGHADDYGTIFKLTPGGVLTTLHVFSGDYSSGLYPHSLMQASDGNFYGTSQSGIFKMTPAGVFTVLYQSPYQNLTSGRLVEDGNGFVYGLFSEDVPKLIKVGFDGSINATPFGDPGVGGYGYLMRASDGRFYGVSQYGGPLNGSICRLNPNGSPTATFDVLQTGYSAPGIPGAKFSSIGEPAINTTGSLAFFGGVTGTGITTTNKYGIWANGQLVARSGTGTAPGTNGGVFKTFFDPIMNENGVVAFRAQLIQGVANTDTTNDIGVWANDVGSVRLIAREGTQAAGTADGVTFLTINDFVQPGAYVSDSEAEDPTCGMLLIATLTGTGVVTANNQGIWAVGQDKALHLIVRKGDTVNGKVVKSLSFLPTITNAPGQARGFSLNTGNFIYKAGFTDGTFSICKVVLN